MKIASIPEWRAFQSEDPILNADLKKSNAHLEPHFNQLIQFQPNGLYTHMGAGTNKLNIHTVTCFATAFAQNKTKGQTFLIAHDHRHNSKLFAKRIAQVITNLGLKPVLFAENKPQPSTLVSYVIQKQNLAGAIYVGAKSIDKHINGIRLYDAQGFVYQWSSYQQLNTLLNQVKHVKPKRLLKTKKAFNFVQEKIINQYLDQTLKTVPLFDQTTPLKLAFSPLKGAGGDLIKTLLAKTKHTVFITPKQFKVDPDFEKIKAKTLKSSKAYVKTYRLASRKKADLGLITDAETRDIGLFVKYKKRYKILKAADIGAIYLDYKLSMLKKSGKLSSDAFIIKSMLASDLIAKVAAHYQVKVIDTPLGLFDFSKIILQEKGQFILAVDENQSMLTNLALSKDKDSVQTIVAMLDVISYYKSQNKSIFTRLKELYKLYGIHRNSSFDKKIAPKTYQTLLKTLRHTKTIAGQKVDKSNLEYKAFNTDSALKLTKVKFKNGSFFTIKFDPNSAKNLKVYVQTVGKKSEELMDIVVFEKQISDWINDKTEVFENKSWSWKGFFKYVIFIAIIIGIMAFVFLIVYKDASQKTASGKKIGDLSPYSMASIIADGANRWIWFSFWSWMFVTKLLNAWKLKRMLLVQKQKVKIRHLLIGQIMGSVISFVTPFAIGGDAIGYWYMRRKGINRSALIATYASDTLLFQAKFVLETVILVGIGWPIYQDIFNRGDPQASAALIWFMIGVGWTIFATIMIFTLTLSRRFQEFCFRNALKLIEWSKWVVISDPGYLLAKYQYEFWGIRKGMKDLWLKWWFPIEMIFYSMAPLFFNPTTLLLLSTGWINDSVNGVNGYMAVIVIDDIINTANSMSLTPGGSGTAEWLTQVTKQLIYNSNHSEHGHIIHFSTQGITSAVDLINKLFFSWPMLFFSTMLIVSIVPLENYRIAKAKRKIVQYKLFILLAWICLLAGFFTYFTLIL